MCRSIIMPDGKIVDSISEDGSCTCVNTVKEIHHWIVENVELEIGDGQKLTIDHGVFDYVVKIEKGEMHDDSEPHLSKTTNLNPKKIKPNSP